MRKTINETTKTTLTLIAIVLAVILAILLFNVSMAMPIPEGARDPNGSEIGMFYDAILYTAIIVVLFLTILIVATNKISDNRTLAIVWTVTILLSSIYPVIQAVKKFENDKELAAKDDAKRRLYTGTATMSDFQYLLENDDEEIIIIALENDYSKIAKEVINAVCDPSSDRIFNNSIAKSERLYDVEVYGKELARQKYIRRLYFRLEEKELTEGVEYLLAKESDIINIDTVEFMLRLSNITNPIGGIKSEFNNYKRRGLQIRTSGI